MKAVHEFSARPISAERRAELDEVERLVEAELPEILARNTGVRWADAFALRVAAHQLRAAREQKGLTLDAAAALVGMATDDLRRLEAGRGDASVYTLGRLAASYGYQVRISVEPVGAA